jgi:hypothetical protein
VQDVTGILREELLELVFVLFEIQQFQEPQRQQVLVEFTVWHDGNQIS